MKIILFTLLLIPMSLYAQDSFGFDTGASGLSVSIGGEVSAELTGFIDDFGPVDRIRNSNLGDIFSGRLNFQAGGSSAEAVINLSLRPVFDGSSPIDIDEAYVRAFFEPLTLTGGLRKLTWGRADSFGPLDVINPIDYTDLTRLSVPSRIKIARPMVHGIWSLGAFSRLQAVFIPNFRGHDFTLSGRWAPSQIVSLGQFLDLEDFYSDYNNTLEYAQAGLRYTTTIGSSDLGLQYYFGRLQRPRLIIGPAGPDIDYNPYHQIGMDFAKVIAGFNLRAEAAANITSDLNGTDGTIENPALAWSLGFDRDLFAGINLNLQGSGSFRLFHSSLNDNPLLDVEYGSRPTSTRLTGILSRKFFRDELELKTTGLWGIEDRDFLIMPAIIWSRNDVSAELSAGFFGGNKEGELGQYRENSFIRLLLTYIF